jgi:hypothetical protein
LIVFLAAAGALWATGRATLGVGMQDVPGPTRLVADPELALRGGAVEPPLELHEIVREPIDARGRLRVDRKECQGDGLLVDVHPDVDD